MACERSCDARLKVLEERYNDQDVLMDILTSYLDHKIGDIAMLLGENSRDIKELRQVKQDIYKAFSEVLDDLKNITKEVGHEG